MRAICRRIGAAAISLMPWERFSAAGLFRSGPERMRAFRGAAALGRSCSMAAGFPANAFAPATRRGGSSVMPRIKCPPPALASATQYLHRRDLLKLLFASLNSKRRCSDGSASHWLIWARVAVMANESRAVLRRMVLYRIPAGSGWMSICD